MVKCKKCDHRLRYEENTHDIGYYHLVDGIVLCWNCRRKLRKEIRKWLGLRWWE